MKLRGHSKLTGEGLGFTPNELDEIEAIPQLFVDAPTSLLREMLSVWQQWAPGGARGSSEYANLDSLRRAVDKLGLGRMAQELAV